MPKPTKDLTGQRFGKLVVTNRAPSVNYYTRWNCVCDCGNKSTVYATNLLKGSTTSCGCARRRVKHGMSNTREYGLLAHARERAKRLGIECTLEISDIHIPDTCPVLGIELYSGSGKQSDHSPTLDRVDVSGGYTPDNAVVISLLANRIKDKSWSSEMVRKVADWMEGQGL